MWAWHSSPPPRRGSDTSTTPPVWRRPSRPSASMPSSPRGRARTGVRACPGSCHKVGRRSSPSLVESGLDKPRNPRSGPHPRSYMSQTGQSAHVGTIVEIKGVVVDAVFPGDMPAIYNALEIDVPATGSRDVLARARGGGAAAPGRRARARDRDGRDRRPGPRPRGARHRRADHRAGRRGDARPHLQRARRDDRQRRPGRRPRSAGRSIARRRSSRCCRRPPRSSRPGSR